MLSEIDVTPAPSLVLTAADVAAAMSGDLIAGVPGDPVAGFSIDTRTLAPGDLFVALRGQRFDGHQFVGAALEQKACGAVVSEAPAVPLAGKERPAPIFVRVADTTRALQDLARHVRRASGARVVAITGSAGKTTTKEITAEFLSTRYSVFRNRGNLNNHIGLPLSLLELRHRPDVAVVELGMSHAGEIRLLTSIAEPECRVWTNVSEVHAEFFPSVEAIADAKAEIFEGGLSRTLLVANADDPRVMARAPKFAGRVVTFGIDRPADVFAANIRDLGLDGMAAVVQTPAGTTELQTPLLGRANLANVLAATAVALQFDVGLEDIVHCAGTLQPVAHRGQILRLRDGVTVIDDSYNSNPAAVMRALQVVGGESRFTRRVAVLGEMFELGQRSVALHEECGRAATGAGLTSLITVGGEPARRLAAAAVEAGLPESRVQHLATSDEAADVVAALVRPGDLVLVKGSRGVRTDRVVERLRAEFA